MCGLGTWELLIVLGIVVLLFGASRLPQLGKALGDTVRNFKKGTEGPESINSSTDDAKQRDEIEAHEVAQIVDVEDERDRARKG